MKAICIVCFGFGRALRQKNKPNLVGVVLFCVLLAVAPRFATANGTNLLKDSGFEAQIPPDQSGWVLFDESRFSTAHARQGRGSMFNWGFSRNLPTAPFLTGTVSGSYQEFPAAPGSRWRLTGYGLTAAALRGTPAFGILQLSFFDASGNDLGTVETAGGSGARAKTSNEVNSKTTAGKWIMLDTGVATAPAGAAKVQAFTLYVDYSGADISQGVYFDDLHLCALADNATICK